MIEKIEGAGALAHPIKGARLTVIGAIGDVEQDVWSPVSVWKDSPGWTG